MDLENYTNVNIFKRTYEQSEVPNKDQMIVHSHEIYKQANHSASGPVQHAFNPYTNNFGTTLGKYFEY